jgi:hypothetical protein
VTDFGLAKRSSGDVQLTATGQVVGTPAYMAPEQARESKDAGPAADVYSLGAILYFLLTGRPPFQADSVTDLLIKVVMEAPVRPSQIRADVPFEIEALCMKCLAKAPQDRFADAQELFAALAPITDRYLAPSANLTPSAAQLAFAQGPTTPSLGSLPVTPTADSVPSLRTALPSAPAAAPAPAPVPAPAPAPAPASVEAKRRTTPIVLGLVAVVLVCVAAYLVTRDRSKPLPPVPGAEVAHVEKLAWPAPGRADFQVKAELRAPGASKAADGSVRLTAGTPMQIHLTAERDCRVSVWVLDPAGQATRIFPNDDDTDDRLIANRERVLPRAGVYELEAAATVGEGLERLRVIATTGEQPPFPPGAKAGRFAAYSTDAQREQLASTVRGIVVKKPRAGDPPAQTGAVAEAEIPFRVPK